MSDSLVAWLHDEPVAELERSKNGTIRLAYLPDAIDARELNRPLLSCSLTIRSGSLDATAFVDGLLPEGGYRRFIADRAHLPSHDTFGLIERYGRDIAGAVQFLPPGQHPTADAHWSIEPLDSNQIDEIVADLPNNPLAIVDESELSLGGLQDKMLLVRTTDGGWARPLGGQPSTHILKRDHDRHQGIVLAECEALALARRAGLTNVEAWIERHGDYDCIVVERFDRLIGPDGSVVGRTHQEDACQALGRPPTQKYATRRGGGGPEFSEIADLVDRYSPNPYDQLDRLAALAAFTAIIGNADAHGKNVAFLLDPSGTIELAPIYDTVPTALWPKLVKEAAMTVGGSASFDAMGSAAIAREARLWKHSPTSAVAAARRCAELLIDAIDSEAIDPDGALAQRVKSTAPRFLDEPSP